MKQLFKSKLWIVFCIGLTMYSGCAYTIPSRAENAVAIHPTALYPVNVFVAPFADKRPTEQKIEAKRISWPGTKGQIDYYGENVSNGLPDAIAEYLTTARVFNQANRTDLYVNDALLKSKGYHAILSANLGELNTGFTVPKWVLILAVAPIPAFFLTLVPIAVWPKEMRFNVVLNDIRIKDLKTGDILWKGRIEIHKDVKRITYHITAKWFLGETAELLSKELVRQLSEAKIKFH